MNKFIRVFLLSLMIASFPIWVGAVSPSVVISQFYLGGSGGTGPSHVYIELFNRGTATISLQGWTLQSWNPNLAAWQMASLSGSIAPGQYYLIQAGSVGGRVSLPPVDLSTTTIFFESTQGRLAVVNTSTALTSKCGSSSSIFDSVAFGNIDCQIAEYVASSTDLQTFARKEGGCADIDDSTDFSFSSPNPRNSGASRNVCVTSSTVGTRTFAIPDRGGSILQTSGAASSVTVGSVRIQPDPANTAPGGVAVLGYRNVAGKLVSEAAVPVSKLLTKGMFYVEVNGPTNTGIALANPNSQAVTVSYEISSPSFQTPSGGNIIIPPNQQVAKFLTELPFGITAGVEGILSFSSNVPIGVTALRGYTNQRSEFLFATLPIIDPDISSTAVSYLPHFAVNGGWRTEVILMNTGVTPITGTVAFLNSAGQEMAVPIGDTLMASTITYDISARNILKLPLVNKGGTLQTGIVRMTPGAGMRAPAPVGIFSFTGAGVRVTEAGITGTGGSQLRMSVEESGDRDGIGSIQSGVAIVNTGTIGASVTFELTRLDGTSAGSVTQAVPSGTQVAKMVYDLFPALTRPFHGVMRVNSSGSTTSVLAFRLRYNEQADLLISTMPFANELTPASSAEAIFPHFADGAGWTTQFIMFPGVPQASAGSLQFRTAGSQRVDLGIQ